MKSPQRNDMNRIEIRKTKHIYYEFERGEGGQQTEKKKSKQKATFRESPIPMLSIESQNLILFPIEPQTMCTSFYYRQRPTVD